MKSTIKSKSLLYLLTIILIICSTLVLIISINKSEETIIYAEDSISYIMREWDSENNVVLETDKTCDTYTVVRSNTTTMSTGWYVVNNDVTITTRITITGEVNLILCDGKTLTVDRGITTTGATLNFYGQTNDSGKVISGQLNSNYLNNASGIGGMINGAGGTVTIYGGTINSTGGNGGAGIGGGTRGNGGNVTIYGGEVIATSEYGGAGIGGGPQDSVSEDISCYITIYGGKVTATGGSGGSGIGGGTRGNGGNVAIYGGDITATGGGTGSGIGGGSSGAGGEIIIYGGNVTATGGSSSGAGIGGGYGGKGGIVTIYNGNISAIGGSNGSAYAGAGIGGGMTGDGGTFSMYGGTVVVNNENTSAACGIGPGKEYGGTYPKGGNVNIYGGTLTAYAGTYCAAIGGGYGGDGGTINITGGIVNAFGGVQAAAIGNGQAGRVNTAITISGGTINATGGSNGAGIGGGYEGNIGTITISGGEIIATGGTRGTGIGGGGYSREGNISITGGDITAVGGESAVGIGVGYAHHNEVELSVGGGLTVLGSDEGNPTEDDEYTDYETTRYKYMIVKHIHHWSYSKVGENSISVICTSIPCPVDTGLTLTLLSDDFVYDGNKKEASFAPEYSLEAFPNPTIVYYHDNVLISDCINVGEYEAKATIEGITITKTFSIGKGTPTCVAPTVISNLVYDGFSKTLINAGSTSDGEMQYSLDNVTYSASLPTAINAGDYEIYYKVVGDSNHEDSAAASVATSIAKADSVILILPTAKDDLTYTGTAIELINAGSTSDGEMQYSLDNITYSASLPTAINAGDYEIYYKVVGDSNHNDSAIGGPINALITKGYIIPIVSISDWEYGATPSTPSLSGNTGGGDVEYFYKEKGADDSTYSIMVPSYIGAYTIKANIEETANTFAAIATSDFYITKVTPTGYDIPVGLNATYGDILSSVILPANWAWKFSDDIVGNAGVREHIAIYTPQDPIYKAVEESIYVTVAKANPTYTVPNGIESPYNVALSTVGLPDGFTWMDGGQQINTWGESIFKAKYTPSDTDNYNIVENIDVKVNVKWILVDPTQSAVKVTIDDGKTKFDISIQIKVEIKTDISVEEKQTYYANLAKGFISVNEDLFTIYGVKLIRTTNGVAEEIQPSDIKEGTIISIEMAIPEILIGKEFRLLHIHSKEDITEVEKSEYAITADGKTLIVKADRLSDFAFVAKTDNDDNGFVYKNPSHGFCIGWVVFIFVILELLCLCLYIIIRYGFFKGLIEKCKLTSLSDKIDLMTFIGLCVSGGIFLFALIALCVHVCPIAIISFIFALLICLAFTYFFLKDRGFIDKLIKKSKEDEPKPEEKVDTQPKVEEPKEVI